jgi:hypothetical protein
MLSNIPGLVDDLQVWTITKCGRYPVVAAKAIFVSIGRNKYVIIGFTLGLHFSTLLLNAEGLL